MLLGKDWLVTTCAVANGLLLDDQIGQPILLYLLALAGINGLPILGDSLKKRGHCTVSPLAHRRCNAHADVHSSLSFCM